MSDIGELENYLEEFCSENPEIYNHKLIDEPDFRERWQVVAAAQFNYQFDGKELSLAIGLDSSFPHNLPHLFLIPWDQLGFIPHIEHDGWICYAQKEGLVLNSEVPLAILNEAIERAITILYEGSNRENKSDFVDEFESYWLRQENIKKYSSFLTLSEEIEVVYTGEKSEGNSFLFKKENNIDDFLNNQSKRNFTTVSALYVPLDKNNVIPPKYGSNWDIQQIRDIVWSNLTERKRKQLSNKLSKKKLKNIERLFISIPRNKQGQSLIGFEFQYSSIEHPLLEKGKVNKIIPLGVNRYDKQFITSRSGEAHKVSRNKVLLVGCGSIGGYIGFELARAGIARMTLVDYDSMSIENVYRHSLGKNTFGKNKAEALKEVLEDKIPYLKIESYNGKIEELINNDINLEDFDLAIFAIGEPSVELYLNRIITKNDINTKAIFTWVESHGIGGHALLTNNSNSGCFRCLFKYVELDNKQEFYNRASFAAPGQTFFKSIDGCGNTFTPYSALSALNTASLATKLAINTFRNNVEGNPLRSWKGDKKEFINSGFELSNRYNQTEEGLFENRYAYIDHTCSICDGD